MTPEQLKASILQYAIQGKLVEQRVEEGTGEELFQEIKRKREVLIKEKIIKKDKRTNSIINFQNVPLCSSSEINLVFSNDRKPLLISLTDTNLTPVEVYLGVL